MKYFLGYESALEFWRATDAPNAVRRSKAQPGSTTPKAADLSGLGWLSLPATVLVADADSRVNNGCIRSRVWRIPPGVTSFVRIADELYVSSPEACFVQMARVLDPVDTIRLGFELCGTYSPREQDTRGFVRCIPKTDRRRLEAFCHSLAGTAGARKAEAALAHVVDGSASPMETATTMLLCMPPRLGGYGIAQPRMNAEIRVPSSCGGLSNRRGFRCDLYWPDYRLAAEYDSDAFHANSEGIASDSKRRNVLDLLGITVVGITRRQVVDERELERVAVILCRHMGARFRIRSARAADARHELRRRLLRWK